MRFGRDYELRVMIDSEEVLIRPPIRISFDGNKSIRGGLNKLNVDIFNLTESKRLSLVKDREEQKRIPMSLKVGYQNDLELIFKGTVHVGSNRREGPDIITSLESLDGGFDFLNSYTSRTVKKGDKAIDSVLPDMPNIKKGKITGRPTLTRPKVLVGSSTRLIDDMIGPGETWYINDEQLFVVEDNEVTSAYTPVIQASTGLLSTPQRENKLVTFETRINPSVSIGGLGELVSVTAPHLNGVYKIETINYKGDNYGDDWNQECTGILASSTYVAL